MLPTLLQAGHRPRQERRPRKQLEPVRRRNEAAHLRNENVGDQSPDLAVTDRGQDRDRSSEITRIQFVEDENERGQRRDVTDQTGHRR